ncbi:hypothetical protein [Tunicatimonas pelagia]|uniref:hypothetical protein n=1 Tax=Tunicatimonas pelagia TaxID=931531 RepID=UPI0026664BFC|nr:hypothetical protein [Tunicatimonas pelagia]WKN41726.1 hypothetical protein P0M28_22055 [Tunicatimonas pelagia]
MKTVFRKYFVMIGLLVVVSPVFSQIAEDAILFGQYSPIGTARIQAIGGAGFALGGDASAAALNPAGLGFYNRSSIVVTPNAYVRTTNTNYLGASSEVFGNQFNIANFGIVINNTKDDLIPADWRGGSFAVTYNQINSLNFEAEYGSATTGASILDAFAGEANFLVDEFGENFGTIQQRVNNGDIIGFAEAALQNFLIRPDDTGRNFFRSTPDDATTNQAGTISATGNLSQWNFAYGGNYKDKIYVGVSVGFRGFSYELEKEYRETYNYTQQYQDFIDGDNFFYPGGEGRDNVSVDFVDYNQLNEVINISGTGINANLGVIYRPLTELTVGLSYQTPTYYSVRAEEFFDLYSEVVGILEVDDVDQIFNIGDGTGNSGLVQGNQVISEYNLSTPSRTGIGLSYFFEKSGFITLDAEYVNYEANRFSTNENFSVNEVNNDVENLFKSVFNFRAGGEFRYKILRFRAGYAFYDDPTLFPDDRLNRDRTILSGGVGIGLPSFFVDLTVSRTSFDSDFSPYRGAAFIPQENTQTRALLTLGFNF